MMVLREVGAERILLPKDAFCDDVISDGPL